jgi:hypothetical protein
MIKSIYLNGKERVKLNNLKKRIHAPTDDAFFFAIVKAIIDSTNANNLKKGILLEIEREKTEI